MNYEYIEQLLERYFQAQTQEPEEAILRAFFQQPTLPPHLAAYAPLFTWAAAAQQSAPLGTDFDERLLQRLDMQPTAEAPRVKAVRITLLDRLQPLWRASAAVAIITLLSMAAQESLRQSEPKSSQQALQELRVLQNEPNLERLQPRGVDKQVAVGADSLRPTKSLDPLSEQ